MNERDDIVDDGFRWPTCRECGTELNLIRPHTFECPKCDTNVQPRGLDDDSLRDWWRQRGGEFHGPNIEHGSIRESLLLPLLRELFDRPPIDMVLFCPECGAQHIDAPDPKTDWTNPPHRSHRCHDCGTIWRPADIATNGVAHIRTRGTADSWDGADATRAATFKTIAEGLGVSLGNVQASRSLDHCKLIAKQALEWASKKVSGLELPLPVTPDGSPDWRQLLDDLMQEIADHIDITAKKIGKRPAWRRAVEARGRFSR